MRVLIAAVVVALALGFTVKDMDSDTAASPSDAWEARASSFDESLKVSQTGTDVRDWLFESLGESDPTKY